MTSEPELPLETPLAPVEAPALTVFPPGPAPLADEVPEAPADETEKEGTITDAAGQTVRVRRKRRAESKPSKSFQVERKLCVKCDVTNKESRADGRLPLEDKFVILWDCKSVEKAVNLQDHLETQFDGYLRKERELGAQPLAFLVIGPAFTDQSIKRAHQFKAQTNWDIALVTATGLKHLAEQWYATSPGKPFPVRLFNRTEVIDKERADFLLSLALATTTCTEVRIGAFHEIARGAGQTNGMV